MSSIEQFKATAKQKFDNDLSLIPSRIIPKIYRDNKILIPKGKTLVFMCAPPASGKTTFCSKYFKGLLGVKVVDADVIYAIQTLINGYEDEESSLEKWYETLEDALASNYVVVSDSDSILPEMRANMLNKLRGYYDNTVLIVLDIPLETIISQHHNRNPDGDKSRSVAERIFLDIQLEEPKKYFMGIDKVCIIKDVSNVHVKLI